MKTYTIIIGSMDDFEGVEDLVDYAEQEGFDGSLNYSVQEFDLPKECCARTATLVGRGLAFENDWSMDGSYSFLIHGTLNPNTPTQTQLHDLWEIK
jgi:hypothetical protein